MHIQVLNKMDLDLGDIADPRVETRAINITSSNATFRCAVGRTRLVHGYEEGGGGRIIQKMAQVQEYEDFTIPPGAVVDVQGYARARVSEPDKFEAVPTVIEAKTRGSVVPLWHSRARAYLQKLAEQQEIERHRQRVLAESMSGIRQGLIARDVPPLHADLLLDRAEKLAATGDLFVSPEDNATVMVLVSDKRVKLGEWLDDMALQLLGATPQASSSKKSKQDDGVQRARA